MTRGSVESRWWILVAGVLAWGVVSTVLLVSVVVFQVGGSTLVLLSYGAIVLLVLLPVGLYLDGKNVVAAAVGWQPDVTLYVVAGIVGVMIPVLSVAVAGLYLYRRREYVGTP